MTARQNENTILARALAHERWAKCKDRSAATSAARGAFQKRFLDTADPEGDLRLAISKTLPDSTERAILEKDLAVRVEHARKAYYTRLALASAKARRK